MGQAKGAAKHAGATGSPMTTGMLSRSRQERYFRGEGQGIRAPLEPTRTLSGNVKCLGRWGGFSTCNLQEWCAGRVLRGPEG